MSLLEQHNQEQIKEFDKLNLERWEIGYHKANDIKSFLTTNNQLLFDKINQEWVKCLPKEKDFCNCLNQLTQSAIKVGLMKGKQYD